MNYKDAGVDIDEANIFVEGIKSSLDSQISKLLLNNIGGFGAAIDVSFLKEYRRPVLVTSTDGVGTKIRLAIKYNKLEGLGQDLVAMCVNDIAVSGAIPLFMLDYFATSKLNKDQAKLFMDGLIATCVENNILLVGGETAELPGFFKSEEIFDIAGFVVGVVERDNILPVGANFYGYDDVLIGVTSSGPGSNGYSLANKILEEHDIGEMKLSSGQKLYEALLEPTLIYTDVIQALLKNSIQVRAAAHITGGGIVENLARIIPDGLAAHVVRVTWELPEVFRILQKFGKIEDDEMLRVFNCGLGLILCVSRDYAACAKNALTEAGYKNWEIGALTDRTRTMRAVNFI